MLPERDAWAVAAVEAGGGEVVDLADEPEAVVWTGPGRYDGLQDALRRLPEKYRLPLLLHHLDGYSIQAISQMLHLPASTVKGRLYEGRRRLTALLREEDH